MQQSAHLRVFASLLCAVAAVLAAALPVGATWQVNLFSDAHYDPAYGTAQGYGACTSSSAAALGQKNCDAPAALLESTVAELSTRVSDYSVYAGDWQRHGFSRGQLTAADVFTPMAKWMTSIEVSGKLPSPAVVGSWGDNDVVPDYEFNVSATSQPALEERTALLKSGGFFSDTEASVFAKCAYYTRYMDDLTVITLHTLLWARSLKPSVDNTSDPCGQFQFLEDSLAAAQRNGTKVIIVGHIPPTLDVYTVTNKGAFTSEATDMFWERTFQDRYESLVAQYKDTVKLQVYGHTHLLSILAYPAVGVPALILPGITPLFGNAPSYLVGSFANSTWDLLELRMRFLNTSTWTDGMDVKGALGLQNGFADIDGLQSALGSLYTSDRQWSNFEQLHSGGKLSYDVYPGGACGSFCRAVTVCSMIHNEYDAVTACVSKLTAPASLDANVGASIVTSVLILGVVVAVTTILALYKLIPKYRAGELKFSKFEFDIRAQLLNATPKKEKLRREAEAQRRRDALAAAAARREGKDGYAAVAPNRGVSQLRDGAGGANGAVESSQPHSMQQPEDAPTHSHEHHHQHHGHHHAAHSDEPVAVTVLNETDAENAGFEDTHQHPRE